ncbi:lytic polysaccharide monooxygenase auxiliary activity family 9 protein [Streptomyces cavernae]|uniref:lytic polysaccharide monooxygenase auxiliary activity family 9 protein n=1 Tax=Streptomyces cavernae TaxID=2259034 RepID=UPI000FEB8C4E|nr:lytic polysaccharide monooxygenase [Streptomyces cavernae]
MTAHRTVTAAALVGAASVMFLAAPAQAHGAPTDPISRVFACSEDGGADARSAACQAAVAANGGAIGAWDNLRVAGVNGQDRQTIPDGKLCSGGIDVYKGLDVARADWPSTELKPGSELTLTYASTIPHSGTFKVFLTKEGYDPTKPLNWSDLPEKPFATATDPKLVDGVYRFKVKLPADRTGRQMLYTIWQNTSTVDTYYSCSDVVFPTADKGERADDGGSSNEGGSADAGGSGATTGASAPTESGNAGAADAGSAGAPTPNPTGAQTVTSSPVATADGDDTVGMALPLFAGGLVAFLVTAGVAVGLRRRR